MYEIKMSKNDDSPDVLLRNFVHTAIQHFSSMDNFSKKSTYRFLKDGLVIKLSSKTFRESTFLAHI